MPSSRVRLWWVLGMGLLLAGCQAGSFGSFGSSTAPVGPTAKPSITASEITGRWGLAAYHREEDRARTEAAARGQCKQAYVISMGAGGGVMMLTHDSPNVVENLIKVGADGRTYLGPGSEPGGADDREVVSFDGRVLILKWIDPEVAGRYGIMILVRCGAEGAPPPRTSRAAPRN